MAAGDLILSDGKTMTPEDLQKVAAIVFELINTNAKDPGQWELAESLEGVTSLPVFQVIGATYKLVRVAVEILRGVDGREVELMVNQEKTYIQWRYTDDMWNNLIAIADLKGAPGETPVFRKGATGIEWKYASEEDTAWQTLIPFDDLRWKFEDLTEEQIALFWQNLPEDVLSLFQQPATKAAQTANAAAQSANTAAESANAAAQTAGAAAQRANEAAKAAEEAISTIRPDWLAGKESGNYIKNKPEIPTLASAPTEDTLTYVNTDGTEVSYKIGD